MDIESEKCMSVINAPEESIEQFVAFLRQDFDCEATAVTRVDAEGNRVFVTHRGYNAQTLNFFTTELLNGDAGYRAALDSPHQILDWDLVPSYRSSESVRHVLAPAGFSQGTSIPLISSSQQLVGELHLNSSQSSFCANLHELLATRLAWLADAVEAATTRESRALTKRQAEVLALVADGLSNHEIAEELWVSVRTVEAHMRDIIRVLDARTRVQAVVTAMQLGFVDLYGRRGA